MKKSTVIYKKRAAVLISGVLVFGTSSLLGYTPFYKDKTSYEEDLITKVENNTVEEEITSDITEDISCVKHYKKWEEKDGKYIREIDYYMPEKYTKEDIVKIVNEGKEIKPDIKTFEEKDYLNDNEIKNNKEYLSAVIMENNERKVIIEESNIKNNISTSIEIASFLLLSLLSTNEISKRSRKKSKVRKKSL